MKNLANFLIMLTMIFASGTALAADDSEVMPNIVTVDIGPTIIGISFGLSSKFIGAADGDETTGFGIALQYERQIFDRFSVAGRYAYLNIGLDDDDDKLDLSSFSLEVHPRFYPFAGQFFLDAMLSYASLSTEFRERVDEDYGKSFVQGAKSSRSYFKYGAKFGWRIDPGEPGGFIFEHSYGWAGCVGAGEGIGKRISKKLIKPDEDLDDMYSIIEDWISVGGARVSLAFGYRF
jgi:hypothetical protein